MEQEFQSIPAEIKLSWKDSFTMLPVTCRILLQKAPVWTAAMCGAVMLMQIGPASKQASVLSVALFLLVDIATTGCQYKGITEYWLELTQGKAVIPGSQIRRIGTMFLVSWLYVCFVAVGLILFIVPGLLVAARYSLAPVLISVGTNHPFLALQESSRITKNHIMQIIGYFAVTVFVFIPVLVIAFNALGLVDKSFSQDMENSLSWSWSLNHIPSLTAAILITIAGRLFSVNTALLKVRIYTSLLHQLPKNTP